MNKEKIKEIVIAICVSYTIISIGIALFETIMTGTDRNLLDRSQILLWTAIAVFILYTHPMLERLSPLLMALLQYVAAQGLVFLNIWIGGFFTELHEQAYFHAFRSFTAIYVMGAFVYYISIIVSVRRQNRMLRDIRNSVPTDNNGE